MHRANWLTGLYRVLYAALQSKWSTSGLTNVYPPFLTDSVSVLCRTYFCWLFSTQVTQHARPCVVLPVETRNTVRPERIKKRKRELQRIRRIAKIAAEKLSKLLVTLARHGNKS